MTNNYVVRSIEERIARWTHLPSDYGEHFYLLRYGVGQEYKAHHDAFDTDIHNSSDTGMMPTNTAIVVDLMAAACTIKSLCDG
jgi:hypothetical protein